jgi:hypothetical protein
MKRAIMILGVAVLLASAPAPASADGLVLRETQLASPARASLARAIELDRKAHPKAFDAVANVRGVRPEVYSKFQNPAPNALPELRALGAAGLLPMLHALAFTAPDLTLSSRERTALTVGMLEAVGLLRDPRSGPVLAASFESGVKEPAVLRASAVALGRVCGDAELATLTRHTGAADALKLHAIEGLGECRRLESANHLSTQLAAASDDATAEAIARALATLGSSWAWKAMGPAAEAKGLAVREVAARALVSAYAKRPGARAELERALSIVEHPQTATMLRAAAATASAEARAPMEKLATSLEKRK